MALAVEGSYGALEKTSATGPPADKSSQKIGEFLGARRELLGAIADQIQIHLHDRVD
jgi:hypothetical protein